MIESMGLSETRALNGVGWTGRGFGAEVSAEQRP